MSRNIFNLGRPSNHTPLDQRIDFYSIPEPTSGCKIWLAGLRGGYASLCVNGKARVVTRLVWSLAHGEIPSDLKILHKCDNPACVEITHLKIGTQKDNIQDMIQKRRNVYHVGEENAQCRLSDNDIRAIRNDPRNKFEVAAQYKINPYTVNDIKKRRKRSGVSDG